MSSRIDYSNPERAFEQLTGLKRSSLQSGQQQQQRDPNLDKLQQRLAEVDRKIASNEAKIKGSAIYRGVTWVGDKLPGIDSFREDLADERESILANIQDIERSRQRIQETGTGEGGFGAAFKRGVGNLRSTIGGLGAMVGDVEEDDIQNIQAGRQIAREAPRSAEEQAVYEEFQAADGWMESARTLFTNPRLIANLAIESLPSSALSLAGNIAGTVGGGVAGAAAGPGGAATGAVVGGSIGSGLGSFATEYGNAMLETFVSNGVNIDDPDQLKAAISDPELMGEARERGVKRGLAVGAFDALSAGIAGKLGIRVGGGIIGEAATATTGRKIAGAAAGSTVELGAQGTLGGAGEAAGQIATEGRITSPQDVLAEFAGEIPGGAIESGIGVARDVIAGREQTQGNQREDTDLLNALNAFTAQRPEPQPTALLEDQNAVAMRDMGTMRVGGLNLTANQVLEFASNNANNPRIADIMSQPVSDTTKVEQVARVLNAEQAARVEPETVRRISGMIGGTTPVSTTRQFIQDELAQIGDEVVSESPVLSALRDTATAKGKDFVSGLRSITGNYSPPTNQGQTFVARPERGGEGSVIMTPDQTAEEAQREREAQQAFRMAERRQQRFDQATGQGTQREDIRPGAPEPQAQFFLGDAYGDLAGTAATVVESASPGVYRIQYDSPTETDANGNPVTISEEVPALDLVGRVVRGTPRMTQELAGSVRKPRRGTGTDMNPRQSVDRTTTRAIAEAQQPQPPMVTPQEPNLTMTGRQEQPFQYEAQPSLNAQEIPVQDNAAPEGTVESQAQVSGAPGATALPAPPRVLPAPEAPKRRTPPPPVTEREETAQKAPAEDANLPEQDVAEEDMLDVEEHPRMVEHNQRYDDAIDRVQETENATDVRKLAKKLIREGVIDEDDYSELDSRMKDVPSAERWDEGMAALEEAIDQQRDNVGYDIADEIRSEDPRYYSSRSDRVRGPRVKASEVVARTKPETQQETQQEAEPQEEPVDYESVINDRLDKIAERGAQGRVIAKRLRNLLKDKSLTANQLYYAIRMGEVFGRVLPKNAKIDILFVPSMKATNALAAAASGTTLGADVTGSYKPYEISQNGFRGLITMSLAEDMLSVSRENAAHEAFHVIQDMLRAYDPEMFSAINNYFKDGMRIDELDPSILRKLKSLTLDGNRSVYQSLVDDFGDTPLGRFEAQAVAFGALVDAKDRGENMKGLKASISRFVDMLSSLRRGLRNILRKPGSDKLVTIAEAFEGYRTGENQKALEGLSAPLADGTVEEQYSGRIPKNPAITSSLEHNFGVLQSRSFKKGRDLKEFIQARVKSSLEQAGIDAENYESDETFKYLTKMTVKDAEYALQENANAIGWYDEKVSKALAVLSLVHPEIATDRQSKFAFVWALAVTSNGLKVNPNFELAEKAYRTYKETGQMPTKIGIGTAADAIDGHMKLFNKLMDRLGFDELERLMTSRASVKAIEAETGIPISGEAKSETVFGAAILGPKIGNGFFANLYGHFDQLTMDRWLMRTWGRWTGSLISVKQQNVEKGRDVLSKLLASITPAERKELGSIIGVDVDKSDVDTVAMAIHKASIKPANRTKISDIGRGRTDGLSDIVGEAKGKFPQIGYGDEIRKKGNSLTGYLDGQKEAPAGANERKYIRSVFRKSLATLQRKHPKLTMADLQALLWYPEKRLYEAAKTDEVNEGYDDDNAPDYANAAILVAKNAGVSDEAIKRAADEVDARLRSNVGAAGTGRSGSGSTEQYSGRTGQDLATQLRSRFEGTPRVEEGTPREGNVGRKSGGVLASTVTGRVPVTATYSHSEAVAGVYAENGYDAPDFHELTRGKAAARLYSRLINDSKRNNRFGASVYVYPEEEYEGMRLFVTKDGLAGFALKGDDIVSAFKSPKSNDRGVAFSMVRMGVALGGRRLDAFDTVLPSIYSVNGFRAIARMRWNDDYAPDDWSKETFVEFNNGEPDVVFMAYDPKRDGVYTPDEGEYTEDYDDAVARQTAAVNGEQYSARTGRAPAAPNRPLRPMPKFTDANVDEPTRLDDVIYNLQDKLIDVKRLQQNIEKSGKAIGEDKNVYRAEELYHGRAAKRAKDFVSRELSPLLQDMKSKNIPLEVFDEFLHARHAKERNAQIRKVNPNMQDGGSGMTDAEADAYMQSLPNARRIQLEKLAQRVDAIVQETQKMMVSYGLETQDTVNKWNATYKNYVPLQREGFEEDIAGSGAQGMSVRGKTSRRAKGSSLGVVDVLANVAMQRERVITRGERNRVGNALLKLALENPNDSYWFAVDPKSKSTAMAIQKLIAFGVDPIDASKIVGNPVESKVDERTGRLVVRPNTLISVQDNVIATRVNGEDRLIVFNKRNPRAARTATALKNLDAAQINGLLGVVGKVTRYFAAINTQYNPAFGLYNLMRDVQGAAINLGNTPLANDKAKVISHVLTAGVGMYRDLRAERAGGTATSNWAQMAEEFELAGGKTGFRDMFRNSQERADSIRRELDPTRLQKVGDTTVGPVFNWLSDFNEAIENSVRLSAYKVARDKGLSIEESASIAKNITVNFNRKGSWGTTTGMIYAFFNASVQGTARMAEALTGPTGKKIIAGGLMLGMVQAVALAAAGFDEGEIPDWLKDKNLVIPTGGGKYIAIPMPLGYHAIPALSRRATEFFMSGNKSVVGEGIELMSLLADAFNPIGMGGTLAETISPTISDPVIQLATNRDFAGRPIYNENFNSLDPTPGPERTRDGASIIGEYISKAIDSFTGGNGYVPGKFSPTGDQIDFAIGTVTGGAGRTVLNTISTVKAGVTGEDLPNYKIPFVGRMVGDKNEAAAVSGRFYENLKEVNGHQRTLKGMEEKGGDTAEYIRQNPGARFADADAAFYEREVTKLKKERKEIMAGGDKKELARVTEELQQLMTEFNQRYMDAKKEQ